MSLYQRVQTAIANHADTACGCKACRELKALLAALPEDGVIVEREEWERMERDHRAMETLRPNLAPRFAWIFDGFDLKQGSKSMGYADPADAILGTEGDRP